MVKRQTVWLSTMMVLSLMLIGYYTLGTPPATTHQTTAGNSTVGQTVTSNGPTVPAATTTGQSGGATSASTTAASTQPSDWFVQYSLNQSNQQARIIQTLQSELGDSRASNAAVSAAYQELTAIQTQQANASRVHDLLLGEGYPDSLVIYNPNDQVHVYVEAKTITPDAAVRVINLVSQTLGVQSNLVTVTPHA